MSVRLKVGSYILDAAESSSSSTTTGARLLTGTRPGVRWKEDRTTAEIQFFVLVDRDTTANMKTSRDAVVAALTRTVQADVVLESASGTTLRDWLVSTGAWQRVSGSVEAEEGDENGLLLVTLTIERVAPATGSGGDAAGSLDGIDWGYTNEIQGKAAVTATAVFNTIANARTWVQLLRAGSNRPSWMTSKFRFVTPQFRVAQQPNAASPVPDSAYTPVEVSVLFVALPAAWAASTAFDAVIDGDCELAVRARPRVQQEAGARPGFDVLISGRLQFKTEADSTWDSSDTSFVAADGIDAAARACFDVMKADLEQRRNTTVELFDEIEFTPTGKSGEVIFAVNGMAEFDGVFDFTDNVVIETTPRDKVLEGTLGSVVFEDRLGPMRRCFQTGGERATFLPTPAAPPEFIDQTWFNTKDRTIRPIVLPPHGEGPTVYEITWEREWLELSTGGGAGAVPPGNGDIAPPNVGQFG